MAETFSINYLLFMEKSLRQRLNQLECLKSSVANRYSYDNKVTEPMYDVKLVDKKITEINKALFIIDHEIKKSNAQTMIARIFL